MIAGRNRGRRGCAIAEIVIDEDVIEMFVIFMYLGHMYDNDLKNNRIVSTYRILSFEGTQIEKCWNRNQPNNVSPSLPDTNIEKQKISETSP